MKSHKKSSTSKLVTRFDNELRMLLLNDLNNVRGAKHQHPIVNNQARITSRLTVA